MQPVEPCQIGVGPRRIVGEPCQVGNRPLAEELGDVHPVRVVVHLLGAVELEDLVLDVEVQPGERGRVALEERRGPSPDHPVQGGDALLAVQQEPVRPAPGGTSPYRGVLGGGLPQQQAADGMAQIHGAQQSPYLVTVPHVAALELGQQDRPVVDLVEECG